MLRRLALSLFLAGCVLAAKRPLEQDDYDSWRHIQNQTLSPDGHYLAYALFPQEGNGELIVRDLKTGKEKREPIGELPPPPPPNFSNPQAEEAPPAPPGIAVKFSPDNHFLVFSTFATHEAVEAAKLGNSNPAARPRPGVKTPPPLTRNETPKGDVVIVNLASGSTYRAHSAKDFQLPSEATGYVAYLRLPEPVPAPAANGAEREARAKKIEVGELVLRDLETGAQRTFADVTEYMLAKDDKTLVFATAASDISGVYVVNPGETAAPRALFTGKGRFEKLAWDEDQTRLAFLSNVSDSGEPSSKEDAERYALYTWDRSAAAASKLVTPHTAGFPAGWVISSRANLTVAKGGGRIFFGTNPLPPPAKSLNPGVPADERVSVDLWSWKDDYIQPMQKIRAGTERFRSYRAVVEVASGRFCQLSDPAMNDLLPSDDGAYAIGNDDRAYRRMQEYDNNYTDSYVVDVATGERKLVAEKHVGRPSWSPTSRFATYYDGKNWIAISTADGRKVDLTSKLGVAFGNELNDTPGFPDSYKLGGWTRDGRYVLLYDRYDIWRCAPDGSSAVNITQGFGRKNHLIFRLVRFETDDPASRWIDPTQPLLLRVEDEITRDTGFSRTTLDATAPPVKLVYAAKNFAAPIKAKNADVYVTSASTFDEYPDLLVTDATFRELNKVSNADPQMANLLWGTAELVHFNSTDGVPLEGTLYKPANFDPRKKYPLLVYIYERLTQNVHQFVEPRPYNVISPSLYASNGYLVLEPDIAYKVGYPGQSALNCVLPAIQAVVDQGFVNEKAIGIQGHSWGGYQIAYMITRTNRFRAAAAGAPVADMISAYDGIRWGPGIPRQFQYERTQSRIGGNVWQYPLRYIENSPIFMADRINTPLLMIHNDADDAVPWYQGVEYYLALRRLNKEVYLFTYNGEPHNLRRRANQKDYALRLQEFFDYYLKGAAEPEWMEHGIPYLEKPGVAVSLDGDQ